MKIIVLFALIVATGLILWWHGYPTPGTKDIVAVEGQTGQSKNQALAGTHDTQIQKTVELKSNIPSDFLERISKTNYHVATADISFINKAGQEELLKLFRTVKDERPPYLGNLLVTLAWVGDDSVVSEFISNINLDFDWNKTSIIDLNYFGGLLDSMGLLARNSDSALNYLLRITDTLNPREWTKAAFQVVCQALAKSGRFEADNRLSEIAARIDTSDRTGAIIDALSYRDIIRRDGITNVLGRLSADDYLHNLSQWKGTEDGRRWSDWRKRIEATETKRKPQKR